MRTTLSVLAFTAAAATTAAAQPAPVWQEAPTVADMAAAYPSRAREAGVGGSVLLSCTLNQRLAPFACVALSEEPRGYGFGAAARQVAESLVAAPGPDIRKDVEVRVPVTFQPELLTAEAPVVVKPRWAHLPSAEAFQSTFPKTANGVNDVRVTLVCGVQPGGVLADCQVDREEPPGMGYGEGAVALAPRFRVEPWSADGEPLEGARVRVPIRYQLEPVSAASR